MSGDVWCYTLAPFHAGYTVQPRNCWRGPLYFTVSVRRYDFSTGIYRGVPGTTVATIDFSRSVAATGWKMVRYAATLHFRSDDVLRNYQIAFQRSLNGMDRARACLRGTGYERDWRDHLAVRIGGLLRLT